MSARLPAIATLLAALALALPGCDCGGRSPTVARWQSVAPGLDYRTIDQHGTLFHLLKVDLTKNRLALADARKPGRKTETVSTLVDEVGALAGLNGTFFDETERPIGLLVQDGAEKNPLHDTSWFAALVVREGGGGAHAEVLTTEELKDLPPDERTRLSLVVQVGPRTVADGRPLKLKKQVAARSAVGLVSPTELVFLATENGPEESNALAALMARPVAEGGLGCTSGLMMDGGPSTQLFVKTSRFSLDVRGGYGVPNALVVLPR